MADDHKVPDEGRSERTEEMLSQIPDALPEGLRRELEQDIEKLEQVSFTETTVNTRQNMQLWWQRIFFLLALTLSVFHVYTAVFGALPSHQQRTLHVAFGLGLTFILYPAKMEFAEREARRGWIMTGFGLALLIWLVASGETGLYTVLPAVGVLALIQAARHLRLNVLGMPAADVVLSLLGFAGGMYLFVNSADIIRRAGAHNELDLAVGTIGILLVLLAAQRVIGTPLVVVAGVMLAFAYFGEQMPGFLQHGGYSIDRIISTQYLTTEGVFGTPIRVSSTFIYMFMVFAATLQRTGMERFFTELALGSTGWMTGGTGKVSVLTSAFAATITGSSIANTVGNGVFTIPMMKRSGYKPEYAGGVEAASSTGGQFAPPVMGAAAFIMIDFTGLPYSEIVKAAIIPAILFFAAQFVVIHYDSKKLGIGGMPRSQLPNVPRLLARKGYLLVPIVVIFVILAGGATPVRAATYAIGSALVINFVVQLVSLARRRWRAMEDKLTPIAMLDGLVDAARLALPVIVACACAGLIAGVITLTGVGLRVAGELVSLAGERLLATAFLAMIACLIVGIGVPTTANYVITATLAAPALMFFFEPQQVIVAHMFVFYFGVMADITPPVCLAAYAASGIAQSNPLRTGMQAVRFAVSGFVVPYMFLLSPELLLQEATLLSGAQAVATAMGGVFLLGLAVVGYIDRQVNILIRLVLAGSGLLLLHGGAFTDMIGLGLGGAIVFWQWWTGPRARRQAEASNSEMAGTG